MTAAAADFAALIEPVATRLLGEPNRKLSSKTELNSAAAARCRSISARACSSIMRRRGRWHARSDRARKGLDKAGCVQWLVEERLVQRRGPRAQAAHRRDLSLRWRRRRAPVRGRAVRAEGFASARLDPAKRGEWLWSTRGVRQVPYRLPELIEALSLGHLVVVEGERDADRLLAIGVPATRNAGGRANGSRSSAGLRRRQRRHHSRP